MSVPTAAQMNCGYCLYGPPADCSCGTCGAETDCLTCFGMGEDINTLNDPGPRPDCCGTGKAPRSGLT